jgi:hypothetical protein
MTLNKHHKLTEYGKYCMQNNELLTKTPLELMDNANVSGIYGLDSWPSADHNASYCKVISVKQINYCIHKFIFPKV